MNPLAIISKLKNKPVSKLNTGINIIVSGEQLDAPAIARETTEVEVATAEPKASEFKMVDQKDDGQRAKDVLERLKKSRLTGIIAKMPKPEAKEVIEVSKAPPPAELETQSAKPKPKQKKLVLAEDLDASKIPVENLPEGGPKLGDLNPQKLTAEEQGEAAEQGADTTVVEPGAAAAAAAAAATEEKKKSKPRTEKGVVTILPGKMVQIGDTPLRNRLPPPPVYRLKVSDYYMNNRELFVNFINGLFSDYKDDLQDETKNISCDDIGKDTGKVGLLTHQKIVRDYINLYTPYRGLLLYHGLGSGKTCSSIAIAEGLKSYRKIIVMTPASLRRNYIEEIKKCGDLLYRKNQYWEWVSTESNRELIDSLSSVLGLKVSYIERNRGAWLVNVSKPTNYAELSTSDKKSLNNQLDEMIQNKYVFINYNGLRRDKFRELTNNYEKNIFDNAVVIIDEAHNLISRIVNKLNRMHRYGEKTKGAEMEIHTQLAMQLYEFLLRAENCRIILLTGTPIINYPNEIGILFNILRGYIKTWQIPIVDKSKEASKGAPVKLSKETVLGFFETEKTLDYIDYEPSTMTLTVTRNPYGFQNKITSASGYKGVRYDKHDLDEAGNYIHTEDGVVTDEEFIRRIVKVLKHNNIDVIPKSISFTVNTALPDTMNSFINNFIDKETGEIINLEKFKRRIIGLTSYFKSAQEELLPRYDKATDKHIIRVPMSDYQFQIYESARHAERKFEKAKSSKQAKVDENGMFIQPTSTYKIFSRLFCNFVMPKPPGRPSPSQIRASQIGEKLKLAYNKDIAQIKENIDAYISTLPENFLDDPENLQKLRRQIKEYSDSFTLKTITYDFETYLLKQEEREKQEQAQLLPQGQQGQREPVKLSKGEIKERERIAKEREAERKALEKQRAKEEKELEKLRAKEEKELEKQRAKQEKELEKQKAKQEKEASKKGKGKGIVLEIETESDTDTDSESDLESESSDDSVSSYLKGGAPSPKDEDEGAQAAAAATAADENPFEQWVNTEEQDKEFIAFNKYKDEDINFRDKSELEGDEILETIGGDAYKQAIDEAFAFLRTNKEQYLSLDALQTYSPKFLTMIENIQSHEHPGLHLVYSQFRSMEGIGIFALALETNGFARFKISRSGADSWQIDMTEEELGKPTYALYTGTEDSEEREIIRNIYNGDWNNIPNNIATQLRAKSTNNNMGEIIRVLMITSAGSEGINLRNTRYVHIMEPYWHPVRVEQVIGRARRICSHQGLEEQYRTVEVFVYIMVLTEAQLESDSAIELNLKDTSSESPYNPQTTDENLFEISKRKENLTSQLLVGIKEASVDCATHIRSNAKENLRCLSFNQPTVHDFSYKPNVSQEVNDVVAKLNRTEQTWEGQPIRFGREVNGKIEVKTYMLRNKRDVYDYESTTTPGLEPILLGRLIKTGAKEFTIEFI
jgi:hypothetical protein